MHQSILFAAFVGLTTHAFAQESSSFVGMTWNAVNVGQVWPIHWTAGNGNTVSLTLGNSSWNIPIFTDRAAAPGNYDWLVTVPAGFAAGNYTLGLSQTGAGTTYSQLFAVNYVTMPYPPGVNATLISAPIQLPTVTVTYWDANCGCHKTSVTSSLPIATGTGGGATTYTWYDDKCGCTKTAMAPAPTVAPGCGGPGCSNYTAPMPTPTPVAPVSPPEPSSYTGNALKLSSSAFGIIALLVAAVAA